MNRKQIEQNLNKKQADESLSQALTMISSDYYTYSWLQFAMNYYNFYELTVESNFEEVDKLFLSLDQIAKKTIFASFDGQVREVAVKELDDIRNQTIEEMQRLTEIADEFSIYEYMLNRMEKNFDEEALLDVDNNAVTKDMMQSIFSDEDQVLVNARIRSMLSQLPVRMTRNKFYDMLRDSLSIYEGSEVSSVEDFIYMIRSASGLMYASRQWSSQHSEMNELTQNLQYLQGLEYATVSKEEFKKAQGLLSIAVEKIQKTSDRYFSLQEVVNALYTILLNQPYASAEASKEVEPMVETARAIHKAIQDNKRESQEDDVVRLFEFTEGLLERYVQLIGKDESLLEKIENMDQDMIASFMLTKQVTSLSLSKQLTSNSAFINLHHEHKNEKADKAYLNQTYETLVAEFAKALEQGNKLHNRAMIAATLGELPVLFGSMEEVSNYIKNSLAGCHDVAEKLSSIELFYEAIQ